MIKSIVLVVGLLAFLFLIGRVLYDTLGANDLIIYAAVMFGFALALLGFYASENG